MLRYKDITEIRKNENGKRQYSTLRYPLFPYRDSDIYLYGKKLMRLDLLAFKFYGDQTLWPIIARANNIGKGTLLVPPGLRIRIPYPVSDSDAIEAFYEENEIG